MEQIKQFIEEYIPQMDSTEKVYYLFKELGYNTLDTSFSGLEAYGLREKDKEAVKKIYTIANYEKRFQVFLIELKHLSPEIIRNLPLYFEREIQYPLFVITQDYKEYTFILVEKIRESAGVWKRKLVKLNFDREDAYYTDKLVISNMAIQKGISEPAMIYRVLQEAFSVEKVSKLFFDEYKTIFFEIREFLSKQQVNIKQSHEFSQQLLNRIMFIYFIDKKRWLKNSPKFMRWFWSRYIEEKKGKDEFYEMWLKVLFLEAFNNRFSHPQYLPQDVRDALSLAPYLNGGLFKRNELDELSINLPDEFIERILKFFNKYNFTIREDLPLDVEVAVDPQMLGYVYESLSNVAEEIYERQDLGIFYTPKVEVDFMCRRSLVEYLNKKLEVIPKNLIYNFVFNENNKETEKYFNQNLWEKIEEALDELAVLDPACGSGAFLVGMLKVLTELYRTVFRHLNRQMTDYELKKRIVGNSLYGVDVMPWAVHSAELRLWLSLMIESDLTLGDLKLYPLLPNLNLKLRVGDSLVQEIGGINLNLRDIYLSPQLKRKLTELKHEKERYYNNDPTAKFKTESAILQEELRIFRQIIVDRIVNLQNKRVEQFELFEKKFPQQKNLLDKEKLKEKVEREKAKIDEEIEKLKEIKHKLKEQRPFIWDIDFAEIFGEKGGFDIVIGNPPYVPYKKIAPPNKPRAEISPEERQEYKEKLLKSINSFLPDIRIFDRKSDYYIYFYFHGLSLLNEKGTFCFITSNSWLDVGYGKDLQEFLLRYVSIIAIYDNSAKRSFEHADINTIIALFNAPQKDVVRGFNLASENLAKFVMFKRPFEEVINVENLLKIENASSVITTDDFRVYPKKQIYLLEEGREYPKETPKEQQKVVGFNVRKYTGNKWGGKYLRAPDIYFTILEKGKDKLIRLGDIAFIKTGIKESGYSRYILSRGKIIKSGIKDFSKFIPILKNVKEHKTIMISQNDSYIIKKISLIRKKIKSRMSEILWLSMKSDRYICFKNRNLFPFTGNFFGIEIYNTNHSDFLLAMLNSTVIILIAEIFGRKGFGGGATILVKTDLEKLPIIDTNILNSEQKSKLKVILNKMKKREILPIYTELGINPKQPIREQEPKPLPDRKELDDIIFDILGLTEQERKEVYWSVCELVKNRLEKAKSV